MATKHTPGPWTRVVSRGSSAAYTRVGAADFGAVAECTGCRPSQEENAANARLVAAAPELLEIAQWAEAAFSYLAIAHNIACDRPEFKRRFETTRAVILKATAGA